jgi:hypothetical protein
MAVVAPSRYGNYLIASLSLSQIWRFESTWPPEEFGKAPLSLGGWEMRHRLFTTEAAEFTEKSISTLLCELCGASFLAAREGAGAHGHASLQAGCPREYDFPIHSFLLSWETDLQ